MVPTVRGRGCEEGSEGDRGQTSGEEGAPPPAIVLSTQVEVAEEDGCLSTHHYQNNKGQQKESKHVVHLATPTASGGGHTARVGSADNQHSPDTVEDEEELNEDAAKGQDASHERGGDGVGQPVLLRNFTRNLIGVYRLLDWLVRERCIQ